MHIKNISARHKTGNNKSILLTKEIILQIARDRNPHHRKTRQPISIINHLTGFQVMRATTEGIYVGNQTNY